MRGGAGDNCFDRIPYFIAILGEDDQLVAIRTAYRIDGRFVLEYGFNQNVKYLADMRLVFLQCDVFLNFI